MNQVYLCYLTRSKKEKLVKIVYTFVEAKAWQKEMNKITRELTKLRGKYDVYIATHKHTTRKDGASKNSYSKSRRDYFDFIKKHDLDGTETMSSAYFHKWEVST